MPPGPGPWVMRADAGSHGLLTAHRRKTGIPRVKSQRGRGVALPSPPGPRLLHTGVGACGSHQLRDKRRRLWSSLSRAPCGSLQWGPSEGPRTRARAAGRAEQAWAEPLRTAGPWHLAGGPRGHGLLRQTEHHLTSSLQQAWRGLPGLGVAPPEDPVHQQLPTRLLFSRSPSRERMSGPRRRGWEACHQPPSCTTGRLTGGRDAIILEYQAPLILMDGRHFCSNKNGFNNPTAKLLFFGGGKKTR